MNTSPAPDLPAALARRFEARGVLHDKRFLIGLRLPARLLFLFRLRFGLYAVLARLGASVDWAALEGAWAQEVG